MNIFKRVFNFYIDGFRGMTIGRTLWIIILMKLLLIYVIMKIFFLPDHLFKKYSTDEERANHVLENITNTK